MSSIQKLLSEKGKPIVAYDSYIYTLERTLTNKLIFRCQNRDCKGKIQLIMMCRIVMGFRLYV